MPDARGTETPKLTTATFQEMQNCKYLFCFWPEWRWRRAEAHPRRRARPPPGAANAACGGAAAPASGFSALCAAARARGAARSPASRHCPRADFALNLFRDRLIATPGQLRRQFLIAPGTIGPGPSRAGDGLLPPRRGLRDIASGIELVKLMIRALCFETSE